MGLKFAENERAAGEAFLRLAGSTDEFENYANPHAARIAALSDALAARFRLSRADRTAIVFAALLHDMGEMTMKRDYIRRDGPLTEAERLDLQRHPVIGEQEAARAGADRAVQLLVRGHRGGGAQTPVPLGGARVRPARRPRVPLARRPARSALLRARRPRRRGPG